MKLIDVLGSLAVAVYASLLVVVIRDAMISNQLTTLIDGMLWGVILISVALLIAETKGWLR